MYFEEEKDIGLIREQCDYKVLGISFKIDS